MQYLCSLFVDVAKEQKVGLTGRMWQELIMAIRKGRNNTNYSCKKHHTEADHAETMIDRTSKFSVIASVVAAGGYALGGAMGPHLQESKWLRRLPRFGTGVAIILSVGVSFGTATVLNPEFCQRPVHHRQAGEEYAALRETYNDLLRSWCLDRQKSLQDIQQQLKTIDDSKAQLDIRFKKLNASDAVHRQIKPLIHGQPPEREKKNAILHLLRMRTQTGKEQESAFMKKWTDEHRERESKKAQ
jgi:hypothetical protein